jgi:hypothetical protein
VQVKKNLDKFRFILITKQSNRFQSGFFFRHPLLDAFEYYWRVEPSVQYFCDIDYDVFQMMKDNKFKYGKSFLFVTVDGDFFVYIL